MDKPDKFWVWVAVLIVAVFASWGGYWYALENSNYDMQSRGQFGDQFGGVTSVFSGLAFVGVIVAIILQAKELSLQRKEIRMARTEAKHSREELRRTAEAQEKTEFILAEQLFSAKRENDRRSCFETLKLMEEVREDRHFVYSCIQDKIDYKTLNDLQRVKIDRVCRAFDLLGYLDRNELVYPGLIPEFYASTFLIAYEGLLYLHVETVRIKRGSTHLRELIALYERLKLMRDSL